jgi:putative FmdB family regulatory protein
MPLYDYQCEAGHTMEALRRYDQRDDAPTCSCGKAMRRTVSRTHVPPDGVYSYAPNMGDANAFERRHEALRKERSDTGKRTVLSDRHA